MIVSATGIIKARHHYLAFGAERPSQVDATLNTRAFTGHERDAESGLDYMLARYYSSALGRFMAVDPGFDTNLPNPQSWNKYTYVRNNPINAIDPNGAFAEKIHERLTDAALRSAGFGGAATAFIVQANLRQDALLGGGRLNWRAHGTGFGGHKGNRADAQAYADKQLKKAINAANRGNMASAARHLGKGLHTVQDLVAHKDFPNLIENLSKLREHKANDKEPSPEDEAEAGQVSSDYIDAFLSGVGGVEALPDIVIKVNGEKGSFFSEGQKAHRTNSGEYVDENGTHWNNQGAHVR